MRRLGGLSWLACALACGDDGSALAWPPGADGALVLVLDRHDGTSTAFALEADDGSRVPLEGVREVRALVYPRTLFDRPFVAPGELELVTPPARGRRLPRPTRAYALSADRAGRSDWSEIDASGSALTVRGSLCEDFPGSTTYTLPFVGHIGVGVELEEDLLLIGNRPRDPEMHELLTLSPDGVRVVTDELPPELPTLNADRGADGELWFSGFEGRFARASWRDGGLEVLETFTSSTGEDIYWLAAAGDRVVFLLSKPGTLERCEGSRCEVIYRFPRESLDRNGALLALDADHALAAQGNVPGLVRYRSGEVQVEVPPNTERSGINAMAEVPGYGVLVGTDLGQVARSVEGAWREMEGTTFGLRVRVILPFRSGFLLAGAGGNVEEYEVDEGFCQVRKEAADTVRHLMPFRGGLLATPTKLSQGLTLLGLSER